MSSIPEDGRDPEGIRAPTDKNQDWNSKYGSSIGPPDPRSTEIAFRNQDFLHRQNELINNPISAVIGFAGLIAGWALDRSGAALDQMVNKWIDFGAWVDEVTGATAGSVRGTPTQTQNNPGTGMTENNLRTGQLGRPPVLVNPNTPGLPCPPGQETAPAPLSPERTDRDHGKTDTPRSGSSPMDRLHGGDEKPADENPPKDAGAKAPKDAGTGEIGPGNGANSSEESNICNPDGTTGRVPPPSEPRSGDSPRGLQSQSASYTPGDSPSPPSGALLPGDNDGAISHAYDYETVAHGEGVAAPELMDPPAGDEPGEASQRSVGGQASGGHHGSGGLGPVQVHPGGEVSTWRMEGAPKQGPDTGPGTPLLPDGPDTPPHDELLSAGFDTGPGIGGPGLMDPTGGMRSVDPTGGAGGIGPDLPLLPAGPDTGPGIGGPGLMDPTDGMGSVDPTGGAGGDC